MSPAVTEKSDARYDVLLLDLDNTLYDWVAFYADSLWAMITALAEELGEKEDNLLTQFRKVYESKGSVEYAFVVQELDATRRLPRGQIEGLIELAQRTFAKSRRRFLSPYEGVPETIEAAKKAGVAVIGVTNAPFFQAHRRLDQLGLLAHFDALAAWEGFHIPENDPYIGEIRERSERGEYEPRVPRVSSFKRTELKPTCQMFEWALSVADCPAERALAVGDSVEKDLAPAQALGAGAAWCSYGAKPSATHFQTLLKVTPWKADEIKLTYARGKRGKHFTLQRFSDLRAILGLDEAHQA